MNVAPDLLPVARRGGDVVVQVVGDETLVYDIASNAAHCLNPTAALIFSWCDGATTTATAHARLAGAGAASPAEVLDLALNQLSAAGLLDPQPAAQPVAQGSYLAASRRQVLRQAAVVAAAAMALPIIQSIIAPSIAEAGATCGGPGQPCCSGICETNLICMGGAPPTCQPGN